MWIRHYERFTVATMTWLTITEHMFHNAHRYAPFCRNLISVLSSFMTYYSSFDKSNTSGAFGWVGTVYPSETTESRQVFCEARIAQYLVVYCRAGFVLTSLFCWSLYCLSLLDVWLLIISLVSSNDTYYPWWYFSINIIDDVNVECKPLFWNIRLASKRNICTVLGCDITMKKTP